MEIISLDEDRVKILDDCVKKHSDSQEVKCLQLAKNLTINFEPFVMNHSRYKISVPEVYDYTNGIITMEKCTGSNLELTLRENKEHKKGVDFTNELLSFFLGKSFYWHDFAPRNIMIDDSTIWIMDFERGLSTNFDLPLFFLNNVYEEYSAFLLPEERKFHLEDYIRKEKEKKIKVDSLTSKRVIGICKILYGEKDEITIQEYYEALKVILEAEEPYRTKSEIVYPLLELEDYLKENGREEYIKKVMRRKNGKNWKI